MSATPIIDKLKINIEGNDDGAITSLQKLTTALTSLKGIQANSFAAVGTLAGYFKDINREVAAADVEKLKAYTKALSHFATIRNKANKAGVSAEISSGTSGEAIAATATEVTQADAGGGDSIKDAAEKTTDSVKKETAAVKKFKESIANTTPHINKFVASLKRVAFYRAIRSIIKGITTAVSEGFTALRTYSATVGTNLEPTMQSLTQSLTLLKGAFATAFRPLVEWIVPYIMQASSALADFIDKVAQFLSVITGKPGNNTYTKAVLGDLTASNTAAKELKRTLMGFDEINRLDDTSSSGTSTTSGYSFIEAAIDDETVQKYKELWDIIQRIAITISAIFAIIKAVQLIKNLPKVIAFLQGIKAVLGTKSLGILGTIGLIVGVLVVLFEWGDKIGESMHNISDKVGEWNTGNSIVLDTIQFIIEAVSDLLGGLSEVAYYVLHLDFAKAWETVKDTWNRLGELADSYIDKLTTAIQKYKELLGWENKSNTHSVNYNAAGWGDHDVWDEDSGTWLSDTSGYASYDEYVNHIKSVTGRTARANGGLVSTGSMFLAGEAGPEFVGNVGGQTGVWNADQLVSGMYTAFAKALSEQGMTKVQLNLDGKVVYDNVVKRNNRQYTMTGVSALM